MLVYLYPYIFSYVDIYLVWGATSILHKKDSAVAEGLVEVALPHQDDLRGVRLAHGVRAQHQN